MIDHAHIRELRNAPPASRQTAEKSTRAIGTVATEIARIIERFEAQVEQGRAALRGVPEADRPYVAARIVADLGGPTILDRLAVVGRQALAMADATDALRRLLDTGEIGDRR